MREIIDGPVGEIRLDAARRDAAGIDQARHQGAVQHVLEIRLIIVEIRQEQRPGSAAGGRSACVDLKPTS